MLIHLQQSSHSRQSLENHQDRQCSNLCHGWAGGHWKLGSASHLDHYVPQVFHNITNGSWRS
eukprot:4334367-Karenia_brevis.AAC.1